jgi:hypothetical protein
MAAVAVDMPVLSEAMQTVAGRIATMIRDLPDTGVRIPGSDWTVGDTAAHLAITKGAVARYVGAQEDMGYGDGTVAGLAPTNARYLAEYSERSGAGLADLIVENTRLVTQGLGGYPTPHEFAMFIGPMDSATTASYMHTHLMQHGSAIAKALHKPYPVDRETVALTLIFLLHSLPLFVDKRAARGLNASYEIRLRGGARFGIRFDAGEATVEMAPSRKVDCYISAEPVAFFLLAMGLESQWPLIARGKLMTWGPRPWLALKLPRLIVAP